MNVRKLSLRNVARNRECINLQQGMELYYQYNQHDPPWEDDKTR